ncbi:MAG TPA: AAA family ATPase [Candidatus Limnocylindrales bacterium]|nr:AAA family ATPase [Candidatus Limnocylindrales bacterium]
MTDAKGAAAPVAVGATLTAIIVEGFRGIGPQRTLELKPGPGLTLIVGRNGSGKSSFAEGLEILLTGSNWRWAKRSKVWRDGWRNLHQPTGTCVQAQLLVEGEPGPVVLARSWADGAALEGSTLDVRLPSNPKQRASLAALGWTDALETYRPILSYNELGSTFDQPSEFHDRLLAILGLGEYDALAEEARQERLALDRRVKQVRAAVEPLLRRLDATDDDRARRVAAAFRRKAWDLDAAAAVIGGAGEGVGRDGVELAGDALDIAVLRALATIQPPAMEEVLAVAEAIRDGHARREALAATPVGRADELARLLRGALSFHARHETADCPVCGTAGVLDAAWRAAAEAQATELEALAAEARELDAAARQVSARLQRLIGPPPSILERAHEVGLERDAQTLATAWSIFATPAGSTPLDFAEHLEATIDPVITAADALREAAEAELGRREGRWRPLALEVAGWLRDAREAVAAEAESKRLAGEEKRLKQEQLRLKRERFEPVAKQALELWELLRQASSVELESIVLEGTGTQRRVEIGVTIDGVEGAALGVMSQGELHAIALSLFLPRATIPESPFRFVVIDDPVQSMDPARVDGLARVLERVATERQVVVFTHDDRLPEACRRLGVPTAVVEVTRREGSVVELRPGLDPVRRNLDDAWAVARSDFVPEEVARQVVPGFCRAAIEAVCVEAVRRRRLGRGESHTAVEERLAEATTVTTYLALALFDHVKRGDDVVDRLKQWGPQFVEAWSAAKSGAHAGHTGGSLEQLVKDTEQLCSRVRSVA